MTIKFRDLRHAFTTTPPLESLLGGRLARADRVRSVHSQLDCLLGNDRNVVARVGLHGAEAFQVLNTDPDQLSQTYPRRNVYRTVARVPAFTLLPGHFLRLSALISPSGMTDKDPGDGSAVADGAYGEIAAAVTWGGPSADTTTHKIILPASIETFGAENTEAGASWASMRRVEIPIMFPDSVKTAVADLRTWSEGVTAEVAIKFKGGVRCFDLVLQQVPLAYARDVDADSVFSSALTTDGVGTLVKNYPVSFPIEERSATNPTFGSALALDLAHRQHSLGPVFAAWTAWNEAAAVTATEIPMISVTSTTFVNMLRTGLASWKAASPGWSIHGSQCQQFKTSNGKREMRGENAAVPVRVWAYCSRDGAAGSAYLRFQSAGHAVAEIEVASATPAWRSATGYLRCGAHPQDPSSLQIFGKSTAGATDTVNISAMLVEWADL